ncbi:hypothetical protein [Parasitella parasitica]|uniref:Uncharacterized protein n=1 Tax=Parasitella parasitica TaxID=35722 RepID=A0A0B7NVM5_9FUNG|nr:hypothetical protein [Parasitella parasitica]
MRPNQHLLFHVPYTIRSMGVLPAYSASSMEKSIQFYKQRLRSRTHVEENIANVLMRTSIDTRISHSNWDMDKKLDLLGPEGYTDKTYYTHPQNTDLQLWTSKSVYYTRQLPYNISPSAFFSALVNYCSREHCSFTQDYYQEAISTVDVYGRAWYSTITFKSRFYQDHIQQSKRNDTFFKFVVSHIK